jgi:hypothetical protein
LIHHQPKHPLTADAKNRAAEAERYVSQESRSNETDDDKMVADGKHSNRFRVQLNAPGYYQ